MKSIIFTFILFFSISIFPQNTRDTIKIKKDEISSISIKLDSTLNKINLIQKKISVEEKPWIERNGSWIAAIAIGILTVLTNILINYYLRKSSIQTVKLQIENSKDIALKQIKSSTIIAFRQKWIENVRDYISEYISLSTYLYLKIHIRKDTNEDQMVDTFKELALVHEKIKLFLNPKEEKHKEIIVSMKMIRDYIYNKDHSLEEREKILGETTKLTDLTKEVLKEEWQRIKTETI